MFAAVSPRDPFASGERYYLCYSHVLHVKPVVRCAGKPETPSLLPIIGNEVICTNTDEILTLHRRYWASRGGVSPKGLSPKKTKTLLKTIQAQVETAETVMNNQVSAG
jgi:hypothetical protein